MTADNPITDLLAAPLSPDWTIEGLAEQVLGAIAAQRSEEGYEIVLDADATTDRQSRRVLRPLLACLATKSAAEAGTPASLYGGHLSFKRPGPEGLVWILGLFENRPGMVRIVLRRFTSPPQNSEPRAAQPPVFAGAGSLPHASQAATSRPPDELPTRTRPDRSGLAEKRRRAETWAAEYARSASAAASVAHGVVGASPHTVTPLIETMCYEIGKIYRDNWSHADAGRLANSLPTRRISLGPAVGAFFSFIPLLGSLVAAAATARGEHNLLSTAQLIINHFESEH